MEKQDTRVELTEERVREIVREEIAKKLFDIGTFVLEERIKIAKAISGTNILSSTQGYHSP